MTEWTALPSELPRPWRKPPLNPDTRSRLRGSLIPLSDGITHYELTGPDDGELVFLLGGLTVPLFYWDAQPLVPTGTLCG
jgi:hypothetical protein